jgi:hypothetical protein
MKRRRDTSDSRLRGESVLHRPYRQFAEFVAVAVVILLVIPGAESPARAWLNGLPQRPNSFGTHDWVLLKAVKAVGAKGRWIRLRVALRATDDPDSVRDIPYASDHRWHNWGPYKGTTGKAPKAVRIWYRRTVRHLEHGRRREASRGLGIMSHLLSDIAQPMHTADTEAEGSEHLKYEGKVDSRCEGSSSDCIYRFRYDGPDGARPRKRTLREARRAKPYYSELIEEVAEHGYNHEIHRITMRQLNRAANAIADLILTMRQ